MEVFIPLVGPRRRILSTRLAEPPTSYFGRDASTGMCSTGLLHARAAWNCLEVFVIGGGPREQSQGAPCTAQAEKSNPCRLSPVTVPVPLFLHHRLIRHTLITHDFFLVKIWNRHGLICCGASVQGTHKFPECLTSRLALWFVWGRRIGNWDRPLLTCSAKLDGTRWHTWKWKSTQNRTPVLQGKANGCLVIVSGKKKKRTLCQMPVVGTIVYGRLKLCALQLRAESGSSCGVLDLERFVISEAPRNIRTCSQGYRCGGALHCTKKSRDGVP
ncbi:hypothetical protein DFH94DRAFT_209237 [Russula ochroleuca]|jgi:hypothetical protein|uniref:Uncharacterized protein n=1 Tax=Russula ochroleuca TaxID=152965 RepID=A0A9P5MP89_9AGAM|nr:hypothetical protein DFH94DRAFT_209237 [Russula ochroleuca]